MKPFAIFISGRGSNMEALLTAYREERSRAKPVLVISNRSDAPGLQTARRVGVPAEVVPWKDAAAGERQALDLVHSAGAEFIVLAGFMRVVTSVLIDAFPWRIINIHPSLLPAFPGLCAQRQALEYGVRVTGCTTHFVTAGVDSGPVIMQRVVPVEPNDTEASLSARILVEEHRLIVETVNLLADGRLSVVGDRRVDIANGE